MTISPTRAPSLPLATNEYLPAYQDQLLNVLRLYFRQVDNFTQNTIIPPSGTTANRPVTELLIGQFYFDTTLGIPIWYDGTNWVDATGATV
jgi:hypothetical protein